MSLELPTLLQRYQLDSSQAVSGARTGAGALSTLGGAFRSLRGLIEAAGVSLGAFQIGSFLKESVQEASATQQSLRTVTSLFGPSAKEIVDWGESNAASFGIAKGAALQYAQQLGTVLKGFGFIPKAAADMSLSLEKVAGDVAIFRHQDPSQVISAFQAGLYGSTRGLRQYGIDVSATSIKQVALSLGIKTATKDWDAQTKAQVYYALIMRGTTTEVGAASARQHDLAVESKVLSAEMQNLRDRIGTALLPIMSAFIGLVIRDAIPALETFTTWISTAGSWIWSKFAQPLEHAFNVVKLVIDGFIIGIAHPNINLDPFSWVVKSVVGAGEVVRRVVDTIRTTITLLIAGFSGAHANGFLNEWQNDFVRVGNVVRAVVDVIKSAWDHVGPILQPVFNLIDKFLGTTAGKTAAAATGFTILGVSLATVVGGPIYEGLVGLANILSFVTSAIALLPFAAGAWIAGIALMVGAVVYFYKTSSTFRDELHRLLAIFETEWVPKIKDAAEVLRNGFVGAIDAVGPPLLRFGGAILRDVLPALQAVGGFISRNIVPILVGLGIVLAAVITPVVLSGIAALAGLFVSMGATIAGLFSPLVLVVGGIALLAAGAVYAYQHFKAFRDIVGDTVGFVVSLGGAIVRAVVPAFHAVASYVLGSVIPALATVVSVITRDALPVLQAVGSYIIGTLVPNLVSFGTTAAGYVVPALRAVVSFVSANVTPILVGLGVVLAALVTGEVIDGLTALVGLFRSLAIAVGAAASPVELVVAALAVAAAGATYAYIHFKTFHDIVGDVASKASSFGLTLARDVVPVLRAIGDVVSRNILPVLAGLAGAFAAIEGSAIVGWFASLAASVAGFFGPVQLMYLSLGGLTAAIALLVAGLAYAYLHFQSFHDGVDSLAKGIASIFIPAIEGIGAIVQQVFAGVVLPALAELRKTFLSVVSQIVDFVKSHWVEIGDVIRAVMVVVGAIVRVTLDVVMALWKTFGAQIMAIVRDAFDLIGGIVRVSLSVVLGIVGIFLDLITGHFGKAFEDLGKVVRSALDGVGIIARDALKILGNLLVAGAKAAVALFGLALKGLFDVAKGTFDGIGGLIKTLVVGFLAFKIAVSVFAAVEGAIEGLIAAFELLKAAIAGAEVGSIAGEITPVGAALTALGVIIAGVSAVFTIFHKKTTDVAAGFDEMNRSALASGQTMKQVAETYVTDMITKNRDLYDALHKAGIGASEMRDYVLGNGDAIKDVNSKVDAYKNKVSEAIVSQLGFKKGTTEYNIVLAQLTGGLDKAKTNLDGEGRSLKTAGDNARTASGAHRDFNVTQQTTKEKADAARIAIGKENQAFDDQTNSLYNLQTQTNDIETAALTLDQQIITNKANLKAYNDAIANHQPLDAIQSAYDTYKQGLVDTNQQTLDLIQSEKDHAESLVKAAGTTRDTAAGEAIYRAALVKSALQYPVIRALLDVYINGLKAVPKTAPTKVEATNIPTAVQAIHSFRDELKGVPVNHNTSISVSGIDAAIHSMTLLKQTVLKLDPGFNLNILAGEQHGGTPGHAFGGNVDAGRDILVGEQGPEIIRPKVPSVVLTAPETRRTLAAAANPPKVRSALHDTATSVVTTAASAAVSAVSKMREVGSSLMDGLRSGLADGHASAVAQIASTVAAVAKAASNIILPTQPQGPTYVAPVTVSKPPAPVTIPVGTKPPSTPTYIPISPVPTTPVGTKVPTFPIAPPTAPSGGVHWIAPKPAPAPAPRPKTPETPGKILTLPKAATPTPQIPGPTADTVETTMTVTTGSMSVTANAVALIGKTIAQVFTQPVAAPTQSGQSSQPAPVQPPTVVRQPTPKFPVPTNPLVPYKPPTSIGSTPPVVPIYTPPPKEPTGTGWPTSALSGVALKSLTDNIADASRPAPQAATRAEQSTTSITYDVDVHPQETTMTERGLVQELRKAERHGTLHSSTGVPRRLTGGRR